jgi:hypothetical protein
MKKHVSKKSIEAETDSIAPMPVIPANLAIPSTPIVAVPVLHDEEYATELAAPISQDSLNKTSAESIDRTWGWSAMVVSIISLFILPVVMGSAGVALGIIAIIRGNRMLGGWSIAISLISIFTSLILVPYYT